MDYGFVVKGQTIGCTRDELVESLLKRGSEIDFVWTPNTPQPVRPEQVPFLIRALRESETISARNWMLLGGAVVAFCVIQAFASQGLGQLSRSVVFTVGAILLAMGNTKYWRSLRYSQEDAVSDASTARFEKWIYKKSVRSYTITVLASIVLASVFASLAEDSTALAGLVKPAVWRGELWRLFTAPLMHTDFSQFLINAFGLIYLSKLTEQTLHRALLPLLFLVCAVVSSVSSLIFDPLTTLVGGASGGLLGLVGFITTASFFDRTNYPPGYFKRMLVIMAAFFAVNLFGFEFFDPAAGVGGIVAGGILGWLSAKLKRPRVSEKLLKVAGVGGILGVASAAVFAVSRLIS